MRTTGKTKLLSILILVLGYFVASAAEKEIIKDKSPDGKFALRVWKGEEGWVSQKPTRSFTVSSATKRGLSSTARFSVRNRAA